MVGILRHASTPWEHPRRRVCLFDDNGTRARNGKKSQNRKLSTERCNEFISGIKNVPGSVEVSTTCTHLWRYSAPPHLQTSSIISAISPSSPYKYLSPHAKSNPPSDISSHSQLGMPSESPLGASCSSSMWFESWCTAVLEIHQPWPRRH